jgi:hypothetical protein
MPTAAAAAGAAAGVEVAPAAVWAADQLAAASMWSGVIAVIL